MPSDLIKQHIPPAAVLFGSFLPYVLTAAPMVTAGDCGELVSAAFTLGVAHPPGYPLYALAGKAASLVPLGDVASRMNVLSAALMSFTALAAYLIMGVLAGGSRGVHAAAALAAAYCSESWGLATSAEVYPLQILLSLLALYSLARWRKGGGPAFLYTGSFLAGLSVASHYTALVFLPAFALIFTLGAGREDRLRSGVLSAFWFLLGLSVFVYLPLRAAASPPLNFGRPDGIQAFLAHVTRASYGDLGAFRMFTGGAPAAVGLSAGSGGMAVAAIAALAGLMLVLLKRAAGRSFRLLPALLAAGTCLYLLKLGVKGITAAKIHYMAGILREESWWAVLPFAAFGIYRLYVKDRDLFYAASLLLASLTVVMLIRVPVSRTDYALPLAAKFFTPWFVITALLAGVGAAGLADSVRGGRARAVSGALAACAFAFAAMLAVRNHAAADSSRLYWPHDYSVDLMRTFNEGALFLADGDHHPFLGIYQKTVEAARPDVTFLDEAGVVFSGYERMSDIYRGPSQTVYCSQDSELDFFPGIKVRQAGLINWWDMGGVPAPDPAPYYTFRASAVDAADAYFPDRSIYANYNYHMARRYSGMGEYRLAEAALLDVVRVGGDLIWVRVNAGNLYNSWGMPDRAVREYREALRLAPATPAAYMNLGEIYIANGEYRLAREAFETAARYSPGDPGPGRRLEEIKRLEAGEFR
ncbi:MAG: DUF2723 domain-containing protein [Nitrospirae bacterium]|nr:DUF2723 domain-containing protein [Nitrospirota bacterium]